MSARVRCIGGVLDDSIEIVVECHMSNGLPAIVIVGFANKAVDEAKERLRGAFASTNLQLPRKRITINLAPADIPKDGSAFDLALAAAILGASKQIDSSKLSDCAVIGELGLDGSVRSVRGIIGKLLSARSLGIKDCIMPLGNLKQARLVPGINLYPVSSLKDFYLHASGAAPIKAIQADEKELKDAGSGSKYDMGSVVGQEQAKRALEIAAAGGHNVLLNGPPGTGKSMLAKALPSILPPLTRDECLEATHLHSLASKNFETIITAPPYRSPHHSASDIAIIGGGQHPRPGEISLSHAGVLFFDELPEFSRPAVEALRQPLEDHVITIARAKDNVRYPAHFILVATANPCPCGYLGSDKECTCLPQQIVRYQKKLSGPILDRVDLYVHVQGVAHKTLLSDNQAEPSTTIRDRVKRARRRQAERNADSKVNGELNNEDIKGYAALEEDAKNLLDTAAERLGLSPRGYMRTIKVARTIADLDESDIIDSKHISEALQYRPQRTSSGYLA